MGRASLGASSRRPGGLRTARSEQVESTAGQAHQATGYVTPVSAMALEDAEPEDGRNDAEAAVGRVGAAGGLAFHEREQVGQQRQRDQPGASLLGALSSRSLRPARYHEPSEGLEVKNLA